MSVLIKGMEMPENCRRCPFTENVPPGRTRCLITCRFVADRYNAPSPERNKLCPLVALPSAQPERKRGLWIPLKTRPMDEEEKRYWEEHLGYTVGEDFDGIMFDCPMPEDGQEVWVCSKCGNVWQDVCEVDEGIGLEGNGDWDDIVAWMPKPKPWEGKIMEKGEKNDQI